MAVGAKRLYTGRPTIANTTLVAAQTVKMWIKSIVIHNNSSADATITLNLIPTAGTAGLDNEFVQYTISAKSTDIFNDVATLEIGDTIQGLQGTSGSVSVIISGVEVV